MRLHRLPQGLSTDHGTGRSSSTIRRTTERRSRHLWDAATTGNLFHRFLNFGSDCEDSDGGRLDWNVTPRLLPGVWDFDFISHYDLLFCLQFCATALVCQHEAAGRGMAIRVQYHETANKKVNLKGKYLFEWHAGLCVTAGYLRDNFLFVVVVCGRFFCCILIRERLLFVSVYIS